MTTKIDSLKFPSFYAECAYRDGVKDERAGTLESAASYMRHGEAEPVGMDWYARGRLASQLGLVRA